jgi:hypothetical protein
MTAPWRGAHRSSRGYLLPEHGPHVGDLDARCLVRGWRLVGGRRLARFDFVLDV